MSENDILVCSASRSSGYAWYEFGDVLGRRDPPAAWKQVERLVDGSAICLALVLDGDGRLYCFLSGLLSARKTPRSIRDTLALVAPRQELTKAQRGLIAEFLLGDPADLERFTAVIEDLGTDDVSVDVVRLRWFVEGLQRRSEMIPPQVAAALHGITPGGALAADTPQNRYRLAELLLSHREPTTSPGIVALVTGNIAPRSLSAAGGWILSSHSATPAVVLPDLPLALGYNGLPRQLPEHAETECIANAATKVVYEDVASLDTDRREPLVDQGEVGATTGGIPTANESSTMLGLESPPPRGERRAGYGWIAAVLLIGVGVGLGLCRLLR